MTYDITIGTPLTYGYKYDSKTAEIQFLGFEKQSEGNAVYLAFHNGTDYLIPLTEDYKVQIGSPLTDVYGSAEGQLVEMSTDGTFVRNSPVFEVFVKRSIERGEETEVTSAALNLIYNQMYELYIEVRDHCITAEYVQDAILPLSNAITVLREAVEILQRHMDTAESNIETLQSDMTTAQGNISALQSDMSTAQADISDLKPRVTQNETDIADINERILSENDVNTLIATALTNADILMFDTEEVTP